MNEDTRSDPGIASADDPRSDAAIVADARRALFELEIGIRRGLADAHVHAESGRYDQTAMMCVELGALAKAAHVFKAVLG